MFKLTSCARIAALLAVLVLSSGFASGQSTPAADRAPAEAAGEHEALAALAKRVAQSVVAISATTLSIDESGSMSVEELREALSRNRHSVGTGIVVSSDGCILTTQHTLVGRSEYWVTLHDGRLLPAVLVGMDYRADLAVLRIPAAGLTPATFSSDAPAPGEWTLTLGNPAGVGERGPLRPALGKVRGLGRSLPGLSRGEQRDYSNLIETTARIAPGNSGGPVFNAKGEVIGINAAAVAPGLLGPSAFALAITPELLAKVQVLKRGEARASEREVSVSH